MSRLAATAAVLVALFVFGPASALAQDRGRGKAAEGRAQLRGVAERDRISLSDSVRRIQRDTQGQVLGAERVPFDGREVHRVKVLDDRGRVRVYVNDPKRRERRDRPQRSTRGDDD